MRKLLLLALLLVAGTAMAQTVVRSPWTASTGLSVSGSTVTATPSCANLTDDGEGCSSTTRTANTVLAGPTSGSAAAPTFRAMVAADLSGIAVMAPKGRLTLTSGSPVMSAGATAQSTVYYTCMVGNTVPIAGVALTIPSCEVSMGLDAGVPRVASGSIYDVFAVNSSGLKICVGPAWSSSTSRGTGAGTTQIDTNNNGGLWTNTVSITNCWGGASGTTDLGPVSAGAGTYLGSIYATANGQTGMNLGAAPASGGANAILGLYNAYNRVLTAARSQDSTTSWTYASPFGWRSANASNSNRVTYVDGLGQSLARALYGTMYQSNAAVASTGFVGVQFDATSGTPPGIIGVSFSNSNVNGFKITSEDSFMGLGLHYAQAMEDGLTNTVKFWGYGNGQGLAFLVSGM